MIVLGFDTSTPATAVALAGPGHAPRERWEGPGADGRPRHTTRLLELARELADEAATTLANVERVAVGVGPGGFTGLRIAVATAEACARAAGAELVGVCSLRALAHNAGGRPVIAAIDARRGEAFAACLHGDTVLAAPAVLSPQALADLARSAPPGTRPWLAIGDGAERYAGELREAGAEVPDVGSHLHRVSAAAVCELGAAAMPEPGVPVRPAYLRAPDALPTSARPPQGRQPLLKRQ